MKCKHIVERCEKGKCSKARWLVNYAIGIVEQILARTAVTSSLPEIPRLDSRCVCKPMSECKADAISFVGVNCWLTKELNLALTKLRSCEFQ